MSADAIEELGSERYISLLTYRKDGSGVETPVWFAEQGGALVVFTDGTSYKVKRIRRDSRARVAACDVRGKVHGPFFDARAELVPEGGKEEREAYRALLSKYGWQMRLINFFSRLAGRMKRRRVIRLHFGEAGAERSR